MAVISTLVYGTNILS